MTEGTDQSDIGGHDKPTAASQLPVFYENPVPISKERHGDKQIIANDASRFSRRSNAIPINLTEFADVSRHYPIAFATGADPFPVAIVGLRDGENLFVNPEGAWDAGIYIPAYVRRYPFIFMSGDAGKTLTLGLDEVDGVVGEEGGLPLFDEDGEPSEHTKGALEFCRNYNNAVAPTQAFTQALVKNGLLVERQANIAKADGEKLNLTGFQLIDAQKALSLEAATLTEWWKSGWAQAIVAHQISLLNWSSLADRS